MNTDRFKFRVWDNINKRYEKDLTLIDKDGDLCYQDGCKYCNGEHPEDFTIEQCTGLKDKNGKLIFEGDLLGFSKDDEVFTEICWCETLASFMCDDFPETSGNLETCHAHVVEKLKVIGNIHEMEIEE